MVSRQPKEERMARRGRGRGSSGTAAGAGRKKPSKRGAGKRAGTRGAGNRRRGAAASGRQATADRDSVLTLVQIGQMTGNLLSDSAALRPSPSRPAAAHRQRPQAALPPGGGGGVPAAAQRPRRDSIIRTEFADMYSSGVPITSPKGMGTQFGIPLTTISGPAEAAASVVVAHLNPQS